MNFEYELSFFCDVLKKCHIHTSVLSWLDGVVDMVDPRLGSIIGLKSDVSIQSSLGMIESNTKYNLVNDFKLHYVYMRLPLLSEKNILFIGPYLSVPLSSKDIYEIGEKAGLTPAAQRLLKEYYFSVRVLPESDSIFSLIDAFCERIWQTPSFAIVDVNKIHLAPALPIDNAARGESFDEIEASLKMMELRYSFENELIQAVAHGQQHKKNLFEVAFDDQMLEKRASDPVRNAKNYCIIMNTLLRKAAEQGGVHPIYIDRLSSKFAVRIEQISNAGLVADFMKEMFSSYCRLVYKHSMNRYSPIVKKTILVIDSDISAELSLHSLAKAQGISDGYLATIFKRETGKTVSEYIKDKRIEHAKHLLGTTHLQIQTVALYCGIMDVQYFSKIFKKKTEKTPKEYREDARRSRTI